MARKKNYELMDKITKLHSEGCTDGKIAIMLGTPINTVYHYRSKVLKLKATREKKTYLTEDERLKGYILRNIKSSAKRRGLEFNLSMEDLVLPEKCPILEIPLTYKNFINENESNSLEFATVDRYDNSKGYVKGNVWILSRLANNMKNCATPDQLKLFCENILTRL